MDVSIVTYLSVENGLLVFHKIRSALKLDGCLVGSSTAIPEVDRGKGNLEHDNEFAETVALAALVGQVFAEPTVFSSHHPARTTLCFAVQKAA